MTGVGPMVVRVSAPACSVAELQGAAPELTWTPVRQVNGNLATPDDLGVPAELDARDELRASALVDVDDPTLRRLRDTLPDQPGLYLWTADPDPAVRAEPADRAVIYLGRATSRGGLRARLGDELRWVRNGTQRTASYRQANFHGHPRTMVEHDARALYTAVPDPIEAAELERELLAVIAYSVGLTPLANGSSWWSSTEHQRRARDRGYTRLAAAGLLHDDEVG